VEREFKMMLSDEEVEQIKELMVKLNQPLWKSFIPPGLVILTNKLEKAIKEHGS